MLAWATRRLFDNVGLDKLVFWAIASSVEVTICDSPNVKRNVSPKDVRENVVRDDISFSSTI